MIVEIVGMHCAEISAGAEESAHLISRRFWQNESVTHKAFQYLEYFGFLDLLLYGYVLARSLPLSSKEKDSLHG
jgi:hypothetical protein